MNLNKAQALAVAKAFSELTNAGGSKLETLFLSPAQRIHVFAAKRVRVEVYGRTTVPATFSSEKYADFTDFCAAYKID